MRLLGTLLTLAAALAAATTSPRQTVALTSDWRFTVDIEKIGETEQWFREDLDRSAWSKAVVPESLGPL